MIETIFSEVMKIIAPAAVGAGIAIWLQKRNAKGRIHNIGPLIAQSLRGYEQIYSRLADIMVQADRNDLPFHPSTDYIDQHLKELADFGPIFGGLILDIQNQVKRDKEYIDKFNAGASGTRDQNVADMRDVVAAEFVATAKQIRKIVALINDFIADDI